jgi:hypothetical protein
VAVLLDPALVPDLCDGVGGAGLEVVGQAEGVADLVGHDVEEDIAHDLVGDGQGLGARVERPGLGPIPVAGELLDVVVDLDVGFEDLAAPRVGNVGPWRWPPSRHPADGRNAGIVGAPVGVLFGGRRVLGLDGVEEAGFLEGRLPGLDAALDVGRPFGRRRRVDVENDGLHRFALGGGGVLLLQAPAGDELPDRRFVLGPAVIGVVVRKVADAVVAETAHHRLSGSLTKGMDDGRRAGRRGSMSANWGGSPAAAEAAWG